MPGAPIPLTQVCRLVGLPLWSTRRGASPVARKCISRRPGPVGTASRSGSTTLGVSLRDDVATITQDLAFQSTVPLTS